MADENAIFKISGPEVERDHLNVTRLGMYVGRSGSNDLTLANSQISRRHMRVFWQDGGFWVEDLGSANGVWLNNARIEAQVPQRISVGDSIRAGPYVLIFERMLGDEPPPEVGFSRGNGGPSTVREMSPVYPEAVPVPVVPSGVIEVAPITVRPRMSRGPSTISPAQTLVPRVRPRADRYPQGIPDKRSNWMQYLPGIYSDESLDPMAFLGRFLLVFETIHNPITWIIDNFDLYLSPETAPESWIQWIASWFDITILEQLPIERQREIMRQIGWLFMRRGTRVGLERILELTFGVRPEIVENVDGPCTFLVRLPLSHSDSKLDRDAAERIINSQKPAFATYTLEVT